jgi:alpha-L-fucosidase
VVSKNGNLLLNIPLRHDGTIDAEEERLLAGLAAWIAVNGEAIYGTRPWAGRRMAGSGSAHWPSPQARSKSVSLLGHQGKLTWEQTREELVVTVPPATIQREAIALKISRRNLN